MKFAYVLIGCLMIAFGAFASADLITNSGFSEIQTPRLGYWGFLGPAIALIGLVFAKFQGRRFQRRDIGVLVVVGGILQTLGVLPFIQPRILAPTAGHAGVGANELVSFALMLGGLGGFALSTVLVLVSRATNE